MFVSLQIEKSPLRDMMLNNFVRKKGHDEPFAAQSGRDGEAQEVRVLMELIVL